jgi:hypothetical protein
MCRVAPRRFLARNTEKVIELRVRYCVCDTRSTLLAAPYEGLVDPALVTSSDNFRGLQRTLVLNDVRTQFGATLPPAS